jgi:hypothetical protein
MSNTPFTMPGAPPLANPTFVTGPQDKLAAVDVYKQKGSIINSIQDQLTNLGISIPDVLKGGRALASLLPIVTGIKNGALTLSNPTALVTRLLASSTAITSAFKLLGPDVQSTILGGLKDYGPVAVQLAGFATKVQTTNFSNLYQVGNLISSFTNGASTLGIIDKDSIANIAGGIVKQASGYGIPNAYAAVTAGLNDIEILTKAANIALPSVIGSSDIASLKSMASALQPNGLSLQNPHAIDQFAAAFQRATTNGTNPAPMNDSKTFSAVMDAYNSVNSTWNQCTRGGGTYTDLSRITGGSSDFQSVVLNGVMSLPEDDPQKDYALAAVHGPTTVLSDLSDSFPQTVVKTGSSQPRTTTPQSAGLLDKLASLMPGTSFARMPSRSEMDAIRAQAILDGRLPA